MPRGNIVETSKEPEWQSVDEYRDFLKHQSPTNFDWTQLFNAEINCTCCTQGAPAEAAALLKVEDQTPFSKKFGMQDVATLTVSGQSMCTSETLSGTTTVEKLRIEQKTKVVIPGNFTIA